MSFMFCGQETITILPARTEILQIAESCSLRSIIMSDLVIVLNFLLPGSTLRFSSLVVGLLRRGSQYNWTIVY